jgi:putative nucleotidyltransferase with HDIG domain
METFFETLVNETVERINSGDTLENTIQAVASLAGIRDPYTAGHQQRVGIAAGFIAREIGLSESQANGIYIAGLLHDIGKAVIPMEILNKPGKLTADEFDVVKTHSRVGYLILKDIDFPWSVTEAILQHHERLDGSGYPQGLAGDNIILEARILGVTDVVDAMCYPRSYRPALGLEAAIDEIKSRSGILYDAYVVDAYLKLLGMEKPELEKIKPVAAVSDYSFS